MAPNYYQLIEIATKIREILDTNTDLLPEEVNIQFYLDRDKLQTLDKFFFTQQNPGEEYKTEKEKDAINVKVRGINFTYLAK